MRLEFGDETPADKTGQLIEEYRQNRDEIRESIRALNAIHGVDVVTVALAMCNLKSIALMSGMNEKTKLLFANQAFAIVKEFAKLKGIEPGNVSAVAEGLMQQINLMQSSMAEAGLPSNVPMPGDGD